MTPILKTLKTRVDTEDTSDTSDTNDTDTEEPVELEPIEYKVWGSGQQMVAGNRLVYHFDVFMRMRAQHLYFSLMLSGPYSDTFFWNGLWI